MVAQSESLVLLDACSARRHVASSIGRDVHRSTFFRWAKFLGMTAPYSTDEVGAIALYGRVIKVTRNAEIARDKVIELMEIFDGSR